MEEQRPKEGWVKETKEEKNVVNDIKDSWQDGGRV